MRVLLGGRLAVVAAGLLLGAASCAPQPSVGPPGIALAPVCSIQLETYKSNDGGQDLSNGKVFFADSGSSGRFNDFGAFHAAAGPVGNASDTFPGGPSSTDIYGISEAWFHALNSLSVDRAILTPDFPNRSGSFGAVDSAWALFVEDPSATYTTARNGTSLGGTANFNSVAAQPYLPDSEGSRATPRLMFVGSTDPHMFACAASGTDDASLDPNGSRSTTTFLIENVRTGSGPEVAFVQDVLHGDDKMASCDPHAQPLCPQKPATPIHGVGDDKANSGFVSCAMTQDQDSVNTRTLHVVSLHDGKLWHAHLDNFGSAAGAPDRFRQVTPWQDLLAELVPANPDVGDIEDLSVVARYQVLHVFFSTHKNDQRFLFHLARSAGGQWLGPRDVFLESGDAAHGVRIDGPLRLGAGTCAPLAGSGDPDPQSDIVIAMLGLGGSADLVYALRYVGNPVDWGTTRPPSGYSPWFPIANGARDPATALIRGVHVSARPYSDQATPPPTH